MSIDWTHFTPWSSLAGGLLIGMAAAMFYCSAGALPELAESLGVCCVLLRATLPGGSHLFWDWPRRHSLLRWRRLCRK